MTVTRILNPTPLAVPRYVSMEVSAQVIRRSADQVLPVYFADSIGYLPIPVYLKVNGVQVAAKVIYPLDEANVEINDIGKPDIDIKATVIWTPDGIQIKSLLIPLDRGMAELSVIAA